MFTQIIVGIVAFLVVAIVVLCGLAVTKPEMFAKGRKANGEVISLEDKVSQTNTNTMSDKIIGDAKSFNPIINFEEYAIDMGSHNYRAIVEVSSVNYDLLSEREQDMVERGYQNFLNSIKFPIEIYIQTREFGMDSVLKGLQKNINTTAKKYKSIIPYAREYQAQMAELTKYINNTKIKKKYVIVYFDSKDLSDMSALNNYEIKEFALEQLMNRCDTVIAGLKAITGLSAKLLNKPEMAEVVYSYFHRDSYRVANDMVNGNMDSLVVESSRNMEHTSRTTLDDILLECQNKIKKILVNADTPIEELDYYNYIHSVLDYFKQDDRSSFIGDLMSKTYPDAVANGRDEEYIDYANANPDVMNISNFENNAVGVTTHYFEEGFFDDESSLDPTSSNIQQS